MIQYLVLGIAAYFGVKSMQNTAPNTQNAGAQLVKTVAPVSPKIVTPAVVSSSEKIDRDERNTVVSSSNGDSVIGNFVGNFLKKTAGSVLTGLENSAAGVVIKPLHTLVEAKIENEKRLAAQNADTAKTIEKIIAETPKPTPATATKPKTVSSRNERDDRGPRETTKKESAAKNQAERSGESYSGGGSRAERMGAF